ncbi:hypothetical protein SCALM49S_00393 [Streptomyces californicus]
MRIRSACPKTRPGTTSTPCRASSRSHRSVTSVWAVNRGKAVTPPRGTGQSMAPSLAAAHSSTRRRLWRASVSRGSDQGVGVLHGDRLRLVPPAERG